MPYPTPPTFTFEQIELAHARDDHERDRTHALRVARASATLLADGLDALKADRPKVTAEYLDTVIEALDILGDSLKRR